MVDSIKVCIGVCTIKRPGMLAKCLASLKNQEVPSSVMVTILVVDNDAQPTSRGVVKAEATDSPVPILYFHEPRRGIPMARNRVLVEALALNADRLAFIDDDQVAGPSYLSGHLLAAEKHGADVVQPNIASIMPDPVPFWCVGTATPIPIADYDHPNEGRQRKSAGTCGVMFSTRLIRHDGMGLRFDENLALAGGEDANFFMRAHTVGAKIVWSAIPVVIEEEHQTRLTYYRYVERGLGYGGQIFGQHRREHGYWSAVQRFVPVIFVRMARGLGQLAIAPLIAPFDMQQFKFTALEGGRNLAIAAGTIGGLMNMQYEYYRQIDGY